MSEENGSGLEEKDVKKKYDFGVLTDRRKYFQDHPELFPGSVQEQLLTRPPYKGGISWFAYNLAKDVETRHDAHWQLQTFLLWDMWRMMKNHFEGFEGMDKPLSPSDRELKEKEQPKVTRRRSFAT